MSIQRSLLTSCLLILAAFSSWAQQQPVARVAVSVGTATKIGLDGQAEALQVGSSLMSGDRVRTGADAVAILVFSDEGRISVRSDSELWIRQYEVDPAGARTRIELELVRGTVRQISGNASRSQPDRYRLNTPIAVIGVRGTDFLAKTSGDSVEAFVHEGQIVLIPSAPACAGESTSGCQTVALASSSNGLRYVRLTSAGQVENREFRPGELEKVFGIDTARASRTPAVATAGLVASDFKLPVGTQFVTDTIFVAYGSDTSRLPQWTNPGSVSGSSSSGQTSGGTSGSTPDSAAGVGSSANASSQVPSTSPSTSPAAAMVAAAMPTQLVWGRFSSANALPAALLVPFADASQDRHVTVGELGQYALWRANPSGALDASVRGKADFALAGADAVLVQQAGVSSATVTAASLAIDFDMSTFAASVNVHHSATGSAALAVQGRVNEEGVFLGTNATDRVAGAVSRNGREAGYLFSKDVSAGTFRGITLWGRK